MKNRTSPIIVRQSSRLCCENDENQLLSIPAAPYLSTTTVSSMSLHLGVSSVEADSLMVVERFILLATLRDLNSFGDSKSLSLLNGLSVLLSSSLICFLSMLIFPLKCVT